MIDRLIDSTHVVIYCRLESTSYTELEKVAADVKLTFDNAILYNPPGQEIHKVWQGHVWVCAWYRW